MKPAALVARRMHALRLHDAARGASVLEIVRWMGALQAQDYESGLWAIGVRATEATRADIEQALARREIVRTWPMRGTWHFIPATDARWMQDLLASRILPAIRKRSADFGFDEATVSRCRKLVVKALEGGRAAARADLIQRIAPAGLTRDSQAGNHLLRRFGNEGLLCNGMMAGKEPTFALRDEWVGKPVRLDREAALAALALRYFQSHGPATLQDFCWWTGLPLRDARLAVSAAGTGLNMRVIGEMEHWFAGDPRSPTVSAVELLPAFDEHLLGYSERGAVLDGTRANTVCPGGNGVFRPSLVIHGRVAGLWRRKETARSITVEIEPFAPLGADLTRETEKAAARLETFYGKPVRVAMA